MWGLWLNEIKSAAGWVSSRTVTSEVTTLRIVPVEIQSVILEKRLSDMLHAHSAQSVPYLLKSAEVKAHIPDTDVMQMAHQCYVLG